LARLFGQVLKMCERAGLVKLGLIAIDNTFPSLLLHPKARPPLDPATNKPVDRLEDRIELLLEE
jgi:hypothetical protein